MANRSKSSKGYVATPQGDTGMVRATSSKGFISNAEISRVQAQTKQNQAEHDKYSAAGAARKSVSKNKD